MVAVSANRKSVSVYQVLGQTAYMNLQKFQKLIVRFNLDFQNLNVADLGWRVSDSCTSGKGIIATRHFSPGDVVFVDYPMVVCPRSISDELVCVGCYKQENLRPCSLGCGLPICSPSCENGANHKFECKYLKKIVKNSDESNLFPKLLRTVSVIRCLKFDNVGRKIVQYLHKISGPRSCSEVSSCSILCWKF